jgi:hypothetical protein
MQEGQLFAEVEKAEPQKQGGAELVPAGEHELEVQMPRNANVWVFD